MAKVLSVFGIVCQHKSFTPDENTHTTSHWIWLYTCFQLRPLVNELRLCIKFPWLFYTHFKMYFQLLAQADVKLIWAVRVGTGAILNTFSFSNATITDESRPPSGSFRNWVHSKRKGGCQLSPHYANSIVYIKEIISDYQQPIAVCPFKRQAIKTFQ